MKNNPNKDKKVDHPEWAAWRVKDRWAHNLAPADAYYAGWRESLARVREILDAFDARPIAKRLVSWDDPLDAIRAMVGPRPENEDESADPVKGHPVTIDQPVDKPQEVAKEFRLGDLVHVKATYPTHGWIRGQVRSFSGETIGVYLERSHNHGPHEREFVARDLLHLPQPFATKERVGEMQEELRAVHDQNEKFHDQAQKGEDEIERLQIELQEAKDQRDKLLAKTPTHPILGPSKEVNAIKNKIESHSQEQDETFLFHLVDVVWGTTNEDESVPSTDWAARMILQARDSYGGGVGRRVSLAGALVALGKAMHYSTGPEECEENVSIATQHVREALEHMEARGESEEEEEEVPEPSNARVNVACANLKAEHGYFEFPVLLHAREATCPSCGWVNSLVMRNPLSLIAASPPVIQDVIRAVAGPEPDAHVTDGGTAASRDVLAERLRQQRAENWLFVNDDAYTTGELAWAAVSYAAPEPVTHDGNDPWPWDPRWNKCGKDRRRDLVKAGALILAEIERLDRQTLVGPTSDQGAEIPDFSIKLQTEEVRDNPRRFEHADGSPVLWPHCIDGRCPVDECAPGDDDEDETQETRPEWVAWRSKDRQSHDLAPVDAFYAGWREGLAGVSAILDALPAPPPIARGGSPMRYEIRARVKAYADALDAVRAVIGENR